jgi:CO/xanthine dehydrogenase Mo-binding subunit
MSASPTLPPLLAANPRLDQWVRFPSPGHVTVSTGRVEIGQGVLTGMLQIAADELDSRPGPHPAADGRHRSDPQ